ASLEAGRSPAYLNSTVAPSEAGCGNIVLICPTTQGRAHAANWLDGQFAQSCHDQTARRASSAGYQPTLSAS
ncbi:MULTISPECIES: hypothetical protein, partial [unclassified Bradyrhizobium]|uniref:hypothetical protein n=1 Tax=unclassified Bradyrhizobium TaxID=2631580 RepID=UPI0024E06FBD